MTIVNDTESPLETGQRFPFVAILIGFAVLDFLVVPIVDWIGWRALIALPLALFGGQLGLLAIWAALGPQRWIVRLPLTFGLTPLVLLVLHSGLAVLHLARNRGFRLVRWKSEEPAAGDDSPFGTGPGEPQASSGQ